MTRLRGRLAVWLLGAVRRLLCVEASDGDYDTCIYCGVEGCEDGTAEHAPDCPSETGVYVVALRDLWPHGPSICDHCKAQLWPGDSYALIPIEPGERIYEVACVGCSVLVGLSEAESA